MARRRIGDGHVQLVVHFERAVVEVGGPEHAPDAVDNHDLRVQHRRLILIDIDALLQQMRVVGSARKIHRQGVGVVASVRTGILTPRARASASAQSLDGLMMKYGLQMSRVVRAAPIASM